MSSTTQQAVTTAQDPHSGVMYDFRPLFDLLKYNCTDMSYMVNICVWAGKYSALSLTHPAALESEITEVVLQMPNIAEAFREIEASS